MGLQIIPGKVRHTHANSPRTIHKFRSLLLNVCSDSNEARKNELCGASTKPNVGFNVRLRRDVSAHGCDGCCETSYQSFGRAVKFRLPWLGGVVQNLGWVFSRRVGFPRWGCLGDVFVVGGGARE